MLNKLESELNKLEGLGIKRILANNFNKLANDSNINLKIEYKKKTILTFEEYINNGKNLKIKPIDSSLKDKCIAYCPELPFGMLSACSYLNIKTINIISSDTRLTKNLSGILKEMI